MITLQRLIAWTALCLVFGIPTSMHAAQLATIETDRKCSKKEAYCVGESTFSDGSIYNGEFSYGKPNGQGIIFFKDGSRYEGQVLDGIRHGYGEIVLEDGGTYEGNWENGFMHGHGSYSFPCGHQYDGNFVFDKMEGQGKIIFANGETYEGKWKNGLSDGMGIYTRIDGSQYIGDNKKGKRHGHGKVLWPTKDLFVGKWSKGNLDGESYFLFNNNDKLTIEWAEGMENSAFTYSTGSKKISATWTNIERKLKDHGIKDISAQMNNVALALYGLGMEFKAQNNTKEAVKKFHYASDFVKNDQNLLKNIDSQIKELTQETSF